MDYTKTLTNMEIGQSNANFLRTDYANLMATRNRLKDSKLYSDRVWKVSKNRNNNIVTVTREA